MAPLIKVLGEQTQQAAHGLMNLQVTAKGNTTDATAISMGFYGLLSTKGTAFIEVKPPTGASFFKKHVKLIAGNPYFLAVNPIALAVNEVDNTPDSEYAHDIDLSAENYPEGSMILLSFSGKSAGDILVYVNDTDGVRQFEGTISGNGMLEVQIPFEITNA